MAEFQASAELGESYGELEVRHETVTDDDRYFSLKLFIVPPASPCFCSFLLLPPVCSPTPSLHEKTLVILRFYEDKTLAEIAEILQENVNTVKSRLYRTLENQLLQCHKPPLFHIPLVSLRLCLSLMMISL